MQGFKASKDRKLPFIKFEDGETKILQFFQDRAPQRMEKEFNGKPRTTWKFGVLDLTSATCGE